MTIAGPAQAAQPAEGDEAPAAKADASGPPSDELPQMAEKHVLKAIQHFQGNAFGDAEEEFKRASFFAPKWRPLHFNLGVVAEAQGKIGTAVTEYKAFRPYASPEEQMLVDQRIDELSRRKDKIGRAYKRQIGLGATAMTLGVGMVAGAGVLIALSVRYNKEAEAKRDMAMEGMAGGLTQMDIDQLNADAANLENRRKWMPAGAYVLGIVGIMAVVYSFIPLRNSIRSKRQLEGIALGPTRLKWNGGAGMTLRF